MELVKEGVKSFEVGRVTCVNTDWSKVGIGFTLMQKHCACEGVNLIVANEGGSYATSGPGSVQGPSLIIA